MSLSRIVHLPSTASTPKTANLPEPNPNRDTKHIFRKWVTESDGERSQSSFHSLVPRSICSVVGNIGSIHGKAHTL